ncbi:MAG TPA: hypothetical protein VG733_12710 [Chthoniobacteraceae bacterium]|nr:hypothetical protein [Chthoniobacteraceae bacterium]
MRTKALLWPAIFLLHFAGAPSLHATTTDVDPNTFQGVIKAELQDENGHVKPGSEAKIIDLGDRLVITVRDLDGWLYDELKEKRIPNDNWFDKDGMDLISGLSMDELFHPTPPAPGKAPPAVGNPPAPANPAPPGNPPPSASAVREKACHGVNVMTRQVEQKLYLVLGPARLRHIVAEDPAVKQQGDGTFTFTFVIKNDPDDATEWAKLKNVHGDTRAVSITLGFDYKDTVNTLPTMLETEGADLQSQSGFSYRIYSKVTAGLFLGIYLLALVGFIVFAGMPNLLRDPDGPLRDSKCVFSLSRLQLAWWFFIVLGSWLFLLIVTGSRNSLNQTALALVGIGSLTALGGAVAGKINQSLTDNNTQPAAAPPNPAVPAPVANGNAMKTINAQNRPKGFRRGVGAFIFDILSDENTVGFHRFQLLVWNLILGVAFMIDVRNNFAMPDFDTTLLGLLGISAATYAGFKMTPAKQA